MNATIDMVTISSKGQIVIPKKILRDMLTPIRKEAEAKGLTDKDVEKEIKSYRAQKT
jgi:hypothetical protein